MAKRRVRKLVEKRVRKHPLLSGFLLVVFGVSLLLLLVNPTINLGQQPLALVTQGDGSGGTSTFSPGTFTQAWTITYSDRQQFTAGPGQPTLLQFLSVNQEPTYDPTKFWTVDVKVPVTYTGGIKSSCPFWWDRVIVTGTAVVLIENLHTVINNQVQYSGTINLGTVEALGVAWDPCGVNPPVVGQTTEPLELWITNTQVYNSMDPIVRNFAVQFARCFGISKFRLA